MATPRKRSTINKLKKTAVQRKRSLLAVPLAFSTPVFPKGAIGLLLGFWVVDLIALFTLPNFRMLLPGWYPFGNLPFWPTLILGLAGMAYAFGKIPRGNFGPEIAAWVSRTGIFLTVLVAVLFRLHDIHRIMGYPTSADNWLFACQPRLVLDYGQHSLFMPYEPFSTYLVSGVWMLFPQITGVEAMAGGAIVLDLLILWAFYLLGKEAGGRRMGLILMGMAAISKTFVMLTRCAWYPESDVLSGALVLAFAFSGFFKKPTFGEFHPLGPCIDFRRLYLSGLPPLGSGGHRGTLALDRLPTRHAPEDPHGLGPRGGCDVFLGLYFFLYQQRVFCLTKPLGSSFSPMVGGFQWS